MIGFRPAAPPPPPLEHLLWRVTKDGVNGAKRIAEAWVRLMAHGREIRVTVGAALVFSMLFRDDEDGRRIGTHSAGTLQNFLGHGWTQDLDD
jgi:hypothetical protein